MTRQCREFMSSLVCMAVGLAFVIGSVNYGDVRKGVPSAGFFPCIGGILFILLSGVNLVSAIRQNGNHGTGKFFAQPDSLKKLSFLLSALVAYGIALIYLGFFLTTLLFMIFLLKGIEPQRWVPTLIASFSVAILAYILFEVLLKVQLPMGILGDIKIYKFL